jgi:hypothetical protein
VQLGHWRIRGLQNKRVQQKQEFERVKHDRQMWAQTGSVQRPRGEFKAYAILLEVESRAHVGLLLVPCRSRQSWVPHAPDAGELTYPREGYVGGGCRCSSLVSFGHGSFGMGRSVWVVRYGLFGYGSSAMGRLEATRAATCQAGRREELAVSASPESMPPPRASP